MNDDENTVLTEEEASSALDREDETARLVASAFVFALPPAGAVLQGLASAGGM